MQSCIIYDPYINGGKPTNEIIIKWQFDQRVLEPINESIIAEPGAMHSGKLLFTGRVIQEK